MATRVRDADAILNRAKPLTDQNAHEIHPFGRIVKLPIALAEKVCEESVNNLNQLVYEFLVGRDKKLLGIVTVDAAVMQVAPQSWTALAPKVFS